MDKMVQKVMKEGEMKAPVKSIKIKFQKAKGRAIEKAKKK